MYSLFVYQMKICAVNVSFTRVPERDYFCNYFIHWTILEFVTCSANLVVTALLWHWTETFFSHSTIIFLGSLFNSNMQGGASSFHCLAKSVLEFGLK